MQWISWACELHEDLIWLGARSWLILVLNTSCSRKLADIRLPSYLFHSREGLASKWTAWMMVSFSNSFIEEFRVLCWPKITQAWCEAYPALKTKNRLLEKSKENSQEESKKADYQNLRSLKRKKELLGHSKGFEITQVPAIEGRWEKVTKQIGLSPLN